MKSPFIGGQRNVKRLLQYCVCFLMSLSILFVTSPAAAESRIYHLRVTLRNGERYETISASDPFSYCSRYGGTIQCLRDYSLVYSPQMKIKVLDSWVESGDDLTGKWRNILQARGMLQNHNHKALPRLAPLSLSEMRRPD